MSPPHTEVPPAPPPSTSPNGRRVAFSNNIPMAEIAPSPHPLSTIEPRPSVGFDNVHHRGFKLAKGIRIRPMHILSICWRTASPASKCVNLLWPLVPTAIVLQYTHPDDLHLLVFILSYLAMVPCANLIGFASHESTRKLPKVLGHLIEIILASMPETILLLVLLSKKQYYVIQAAALGSLLATLLLCLGVCFLCGGLIYSEQTFNGAVSELGSDLLLTAYVLPFRFFNRAVHVSDFSQWNGPHDSRSFPCDPPRSNGRIGTCPPHLSHHLDLPHACLLYICLLPDALPPQIIRGHARARRGNC